MVLTPNLNAKRLARMVLNPVMAGVSAMLFDFRTTSQSYTQSFPQLAGKKFQDVPFCFDMASVLGLYLSDSHGMLIMCPHPNYIMRVCLCHCLGAMLLASKCLWSFHNISCGSSPVVPSCAAPWNCLEGDNDPSRLGLVLAFCCQDICVSVLHLALHTFSTRTMHALVHALDWVTGGLVQHELCLVSLNVHVRGSLLRVLLALLIHT
jgi:hypothetical protein